jgi:hypothetical protein
MDKDGRWWPETPNGIIEDVFRRPPESGTLYESARMSLAKSALTQDPGFGCD